MEQTHFSKWLKQIMNRNDITIEQLANRAGVSRKDVRNWIRGRSIAQSIVTTDRVRRRDPVYKCKYCDHEGFIKIN